jgi:hypothetical protein
MEYRPWTWKVPENYKETQPKISRQDAHERVSGKAVYTRDIYLPGMLYAKILTSPYAHATIKSIDSSQAEALAGVRDVLKYSDPDIQYDSGIGAWYEVSGNYDILTLPGTSDYYQHPMGVAVVADSEEICDRALKLMNIEWEERPFILDMEESVKPDAIKVMSEVKRVNSKAREPNTVVADDALGGRRGSGCLCRPMARGIPGYLDPPSGYPAVVFDKSYDYEGKGGAASCRVVQDHGDHAVSGSAVRRVFLARAFLMLHSPRGHTGQAGRGKACQANVR